MISSEAIALDPHTADAFYIRDLAYHGLGKLDAADADFAMALKLDGTKPPYAHWGDCTNADPRTSLTATPPQSDPGYLDSILRKAPELKEGITAYNAALDKDKKNDNAGAVQDYTRAADIITQWGAPLFYRAGCKRVLNDGAGALADYTQAIERNPYDARVYYARATLQRQKNKTAEAIGDFTQYIRYRPADYNGYYKRGKCRVDGGDYAERRTMKTRDMTRRSRISRVRSGSTKARRSPTRGGAGPGT